MPRLVDDYSISSQVVDALGVDHTVFFNFTKTANINEWALTLLKHGDANTTLTQSSGPHAGDAYKDVTLQFDDGGGLTSFHNAPTEKTPPQILFKWPTIGATDSNIKLSFGVFGEASAIRIMCHKSGHISSTNDGRPFTRMIQYKVSTDGYISALYGNGSEAKTHLLATATFNDSRFLKSLTDTVFSATEASGDYVLMAPSDDHPNPLEKGLFTFNSQ